MFHLVKRKIIFKSALVITVPYNAVFGVGFSLHKPYKGAYLQFGYLKFLVIVRDISVPWRVDPSAKHQQILDDKLCCSPSSTIDGPQQWWNRPGSGQKPSHGKSTSPGLTMKYYGGFWKMAPNIKGMPEISPFWRVYWHKLPKTYWSKWNTYVLLYWNKPPLCIQHENYDISKQCNKIEWPTYKCIINVYSTNIYII